MASLVLFVWSYARTCSFQCPLSLFFHRSDYLLFLGLSAVEMIIRGAVPNLKKWNILVSVNSI